MLVIRFICCVRCFVAVQQILSFLGRVLCDEPVVIVASAGLRHLCGDQILHVSRSFASAVTLPLSVQSSNQIAENRPPKTGDCSSIVLESSTLIVFHTLSVGRTGHNQPVDTFQAPVGCDKLTRRLFQQFGVRRGVSRSSEVICCCHQSAAEMLLPETIDNDVRQQCPGAGLRICYPVSQG